jgi:hypothetical protein
MKTSFHNLHRFLGVPIEDTNVSKMIKDGFIMNEFAADPRGYVGWKLSRKINATDTVEEIFYTEELIGQLLKYGK